VPDRLTEMKLKPIATNPLCRWSKGLRWPATIRNSGLNLGMEGCGTALNATNCIRSCLFFGAQPPTFLNAQSFADIASLERHANDGDETQSAPVSTARFGALADPSLPLVVLENFVDGARTIEGFDFPANCNLIAGHENRGVSKHFIDRADHVVFLPQYGTISSMNVVTSAGMAMFHYHLSQQRAVAGALPATHVPGAEDVNAFLSTFAKSLPMTSDGERLDKRPIHPTLYLKSHEEILRCHDDHRRRVLLRGTSAQEQNTPLFRIAVVYENKIDTRNLGGLVRNANSYLCPVFYVGKRKINKQGSVGSDHYTELVHLAQIDMDDPSETRRVVEERVVRREQMELWELDLHQDDLYEPSADAGTGHAADVTPPTISLDSSMLFEEVMAARTRSPGGIALIVPQEGIPASAALRGLCTRRLSIVNRGTEQSEHRGLPSQVGAAIALQRLFTMLLQTRPA
jgi:tRNA(Leu) C34 or U34 (ribose-2'-O)-methylase TrmL